MTVFYVISSKEVLTQRPGILDGPKATEKRPTILQGFEQGFGVRVVIARMGLAVYLGNAQVRHKPGDDF